MRIPSAANGVLTWSLLIALLATGASLYGLFDPAAYREETENWALQAKGQDIGNLVAVAALMVSGLLFDRGSYRAGLVWVGTLFYFVYAYLVYSVAVHFNSLFLVYVAVLGLSIYALLFTTDALRSRSARFTGGRTLAGCTLVVVGLLFAALWLSEVVPGVVTGTPPPSLVEAGLWVNPIHVIDLSVVLPGFVLAGALTLKGRHNGLFFAGPWLVFSVLMGASIVAAMVLMTVRGMAGTIPPMVMVSGVVVVSLYAAWRYLGDVTAEPSEDLRRSGGPR